MLLCAQGRTSVPSGTWEDCLRELALVALISFIPGLRRLPFQYVNMEGKDLGNLVLCSDVMKC